MAQIINFPSARIVRCQETRDELSSYYEVALRMGKSPDAAMEAAQIAVDLAHLMNRRQKMHGD